MRTKGTAMEADQLRVESADGFITDYRLSDGHLEVRPIATDTWRRMTEDEIARHVALHTVLARWLEAKLKQVQDSPESQTEKS